MLKLISVFLAAVFALPAIAQQAPVLLTVNTLHDQPLPAKILSARLQSFQYTSEIDANLELPRSKDVTSAEFLLIVYDSKGAVIAGEGWKEAPLSSLVHRQTKLAIAPGDHALLIVKSVTSGGTSLKLDQQMTDKAIKQFVQGQAVTAPAVTVANFAGSKS